MNGNVELHSQLKTSREAAATALAKAEEYRKFLGTPEFDADKEKAFDAAMEEFGTHNQATERLQRQLSSAEEFDRQQERYNRPVETVRHSAGPTGDVPAERHRELFKSYLITGEHTYRSMQPHETHALLSTNQTLGGFLCPADFRTEVIRHEAGTAVIRSMARIVPTDMDPLQFPKVVAGTDPYSSGVSGAWRQEGYVSGGTAPSVQNQPTFGLENIPLHIWQPDAIEIGPKLLRNSAINLDSLLAELLGEVKGLDEDSAFILGSGLGQPEGILTNASVGTIASGTTSGISYGGLVDLNTGLVSQYRQNATYLVRSTTYGVMLKIVDTQNRPIFPVNQPVDQLWTRPIRFSEFMPAVTTGNKAVVFGDFRRGYCIADGDEFRIQRLVERYAPNVGFLASAMVGGQVVQPLAFKTLSIQ